MTELPDYREQFASRLRGLREASNLSIEEASEQGGLSPTFWGSVERMVQEPCLNIIFGFAKGMGVSVPTLMTLRDARAQGTARTELDNLLDLMSSDQLRLIAQISRLVFDYKSSATAPDPQSPMP